MFFGELYAHLKYLSFAERAERRGYERIANLMRALADSEYRHAKSFFSILERPGSFTKTLKGFGAAERFEHERLYPMVAEYARQTEGFLSAQAYQAAASAEKVHESLLKEAEDLDAFDRDRIYVCSICGHVLTDVDQTGRCPVCGADKRWLRLFEAEEN